MDKLRTPAVELLESRIAPATFLFTGLDDAGPGSLREAVAKANDNVGADTIVFARGLVGTLNLSSGQIEITDRLTINGHLERAEFSFFRMPCLHSKAARWRPTLVPLENRSKKRNAPATGTRY